MLNQDLKFQLNCILALLFRRLDKLIKKASFNLGCPDVCEGEVSQRQVCEGEVSQRQVCEGEVSLDPSV